MWGARVRPGIVVGLLMALGSVAALASEPQAQRAQMEAEAMQRIRLFATELKTTLSQAIEQGGLSQGINVCREMAPHIAKRYSTDGWYIGRTSHKVRNPDNQPDSWEAEQIRYFQQALAAGEKASSLIAIQLDKQQFRLAKPIMTEGLCLSCHGSQLGDDVKAALQSHYPADLATGFSPGELRGILTLKKMLP